MIAKLLISPSLELRQVEIRKILSLSIPNSPNHPDLLYFEANEKLGIEQARRIKEHFSLKPYSTRGRAVVLEDAAALTPEAQNALLKTLEEPPEEAILLLGASSDVDLLPTVLSRVEVVILNSSNVIPSPEGSQTSEGAWGSVKQIATDSSSPRNDKFAEDLENLISSTLEERFAYIEKLKEKQEFLHYMVSYFHKQLYAPTGPLASLDIKNFLQELLQAEQWAAQNVNIRAILEYLMLVMPQEKE